MNKPWVRQTNANANAEGQPWNLVRRWPGISGEDKLAWLHLWGCSRAGLERVCSTGAEVGADQGRTADAGRKRLKNLKAEGLIRIVRHDRVTGQYLLEVPDPELVRRAKPVDWDGQNLLAFSEGGEASSEGIGNEADPGVVSFSAAADGPNAAEEPPEEPPEEPRPPLPSEPSVNPVSAQSGHSPFGDPPLRAKTEGTEGTEGLPAGGSAGGTSGGTSGAGRYSPEEEEEFVAEYVTRRQAEAQHQDPSPSTIADSLTNCAAKLPVVTAEQLAKQQAAVEALVTHIKSRVDDARLRTTPCLRVAWAVVEGRIAREHLDRLLNSLDTARQSEDPKLKLRSPPSAYFVGGAQKIFRRFGVDWDQSKTK